MLRRPAAMLVAALGCAVAGATVYFAAVATSWGARADSVVLGGFTGLAGAWLDGPAAAVVRFVDPRQYALLGAALVAVALARRRPRHALVVAATLAGAAVTSQLLKPLLAAPRPSAGGAGALIPEASWPSGHTTAAMTLALCLVLIAPARLRPAAAALGGAFAVAVSFALMLLGSHFPSDVLGGFCVAGAWLALGLAALSASEARAEAAAPRLRAVLVPSAAVALGGSGAVAAIVLARPGAALAYAQANTTFVAAAVVLAGAALALVGSAAVALRQER